MAFLRIPVEGILVAALVLVLPRRATRSAAGTSALLVGVPLGLLSVLKVLELGFFGVLDRPFNVVTDAGYLGSAVGFVRASLGPVAAAGAVVGAVILAAALVISVPLSVGRVTRLVQRRRRRSMLAVIALAVVWAAGAASGFRVAPHEAVAAADAARLAVGEVQGAAAALRQQRTFDAAVAVDAHRNPSAGDLAGLQGKDVVVAFVESYGRVAVEGPSSASVQAVLNAGSRQLQASGYAARSAFLTSPTFGGVSWLAHATLQSGLWVDNQRSYERLLSGNRTSLNKAFGRAGWRTVAVLPSDRGAWPEGQTYYGFDKIYDSSSLGYAGPGFGFSSMPDQYALRAFERLELGDGRRAPVMAEIDLASSHGPWAPLPSMLDWDSMGDGSVFDRIHGQAESASALWSHRDQVPAAYMTSIAYSLTAIISFVERYGDDHVVLVLLGDHQPATIVSGFGGNRDVPITVIARDPKVIARISSWGWQNGLRPDSSAPVWRMDAFRDRFLGAYSGPAGMVPSPAGAGMQPSTERR
jgi:hypothetical protein